MTQPNETNATPIVGIGASAGGLEALQSLIGALPRDAGACYVIVQHLAPDQQSIMDQLLRPHTHMPVTQIEDREPARADHVYIVPPGVTLSLSDDHFTLSKRPDDRAVYRPIDMFFQSLAEVKGRDSYCVVLSGTGSDGSEGLKAIKSAGGFALVQERAGARFPGMPDSAIATGLVDFVLPADQIPARLQEIMAHRRRLRDSAAHRELRAEIERRLNDITPILTEIGGNDFSGYKPGTLVRRIERRMVLMRSSSVEGFIATLREDPAQAAALAQEFLIGVTQFFRDPDAFSALREHVIRPLVASDRRNIRIWVPGCSTGEEAFTIAIIVLEEIRAAKSDQRVQVFGTDIDLPALASARRGQFSAAAIDALSPDLRNRYFALEGGQYRASSALREACVFAPHNLVQDPPFSRLDLISCRNLLIYLSADLQSRVISRLHFALREDGCLFLGPSESIGETNLFVPMEKTNKIFVRNRSAQTKYSALQDPLPRARATPQKTPSANLDLAYAPQSDSAREILAEREFLQSFAAPFALVTENGEIAYLSYGMTQFVRPNQGVPSTSIDSYLRRELRLPVRNALNEAKETGEIIDVQDVMLGDEGQFAFVDVKLGPAKQDPSLYLLALNRVRAIDEASTSEAVSRRASVDQDMLETENFNLRRQLAATLQEHETSGQELKSTNEELLSMNEELQSSNEELETSREELQSINEELATVNAELQENNRLLTRTNSDLKNLFESTDVAVLFLDRNFCVRNFTPATTSLFGVRKRDIGRPISDLSSKMDYPELKEDAARVDETLQGIEREVSVAATGETFLLRIKPYRTIENVIDGYVLSFLDITNRKNAEETLKRNEQELARQFAELENLYDTTPVGLCLVDKELRWLRINESLASINGFPAEDHIGKRFGELLPDLADALAPPYLEVFRTGKPVLGVEINGETPAEPGIERNWIADFYPVSSDDGVFAVGGCVREVTDQTRLTRQLSHSIAELQNIYDTIPLGLALYDRDLRFLRVNETLARINGFPVEAHVGRTPQELFGDSNPEIIRLLTQVAETGEPIFNYSLVATTPGAGEREYVVDYYPVSVEGEVFAVGATVRDVSDEKQASREMTRQFAELENLYDSMPIGLCLQDKDFRYLRINEKLAELTGRPVSELMGQRPQDIGLPVPDEIEELFRSVVRTGKPVANHPISHVPPGLDEPRHFLVDYYPVNIDGELYAVGGMVRDVTDMHRLLNELAESESRIKRLFDAAPVFIAVCEGPDHVYTYSNPPHTAICGHRDLIGKSILEALPELEGQGVIERFDTVYKTGETLVIPEFKAVFDRDGDGEFEEGWFMQTLEPIRDGDGATMGVATFAYEITDIVESRNLAEQSDAQKSVLTGELQHRVKNTLATIQAVAKLLLRPRDTAAEYQQRFGERLQALSRTHDLLTETDWSVAGFDQIVAAEIAPYTGGAKNRIKRSGPDIDLSSSEAQSIGLAMHELVTNAVKHGALSEPEGRVEITTRIEEDHGFDIAEMTWREIDGPKIVETPAEQGFGSLILEKVLARDLGADVEIDFAEDGLVYRVRFKRGDGNDDT